MVRGAGAGRHAQLGCCAFKQGNRAHVAEPADPTATRGRWLRTTGEYAGRIHRVHQERDCAMGAGDQGRWHSGGLIVDVTMIRSRM